MDYSSCKNNSFPPPNFPECFIGPTISIKSGLGLPGILLLGIFSRPSRLLGIFGFLRIFFGIFCCSSVITWDFITWDFLLDLQITWDFGIFEDIFGKFSETFWDFFCSSGITWDIITWDFFLDPRITWDFGKSQVILVGILY